MLAPSSTIGLALEVANRVPEGDPKAFGVLLVTPEERYKKNITEHKSGRCSQSITACSASRKAPLAQDIRDARALPRAAKAVAPAGTIETLTRQLVLAGENLCSGDNRHDLLQLLYSGLKLYLPLEDLDFDTFKGLNVFADTGVARE